jgi:hypothetical protein
MDDGKKYWLDDPRHVDRIYWTLCAVCGVFVVLGAFLAGKDPVHFRWERWVGFIALVGFASYSFIVFAGKVWRKIVRREDDSCDT